MWYPETNKVIICECAHFDEQYTYEGRLLTPEECVDPEPWPLIPENEYDALSDDIATGFEVQPLGHAVNQPAIDSDVEEEEPVIDQPPKDSTPIMDVEEEHEDNRPIA